MDDGRVVNPVFKPERGGRGLIPAFCAPAGKDWEIQGLISTLETRYLGATCPTGTAKIRTSVGMMYNLRDSRLTLDVAGRLNTTAPVVGRWK